MVDVDGCDPARQGVKLTDELLVLIEEGHVLEFVFLALLEHAWRQGGEAAVLKAGSTGLRSPCGRGPQ